MKNKNVYIYVLLFLGFGSSVFAQDLLEVLKAEPIENPQYALATFKATRISIGHSVETRKKNTLEINLMTRYWNTPQETSNSFAADRMCARLGFDFGISDRLTFGAGTALPNGIFDSYFKYRLLQQGYKNEGSPLGITILQTGTYRSRELTNIELRDDFSDKLAFTTQFLIARKFTPNFSFQISPTFIHRNSSRFEVDDNNHFALGFGGRYKVGNHVSIVSEYYYVANQLKSMETFGAFVLGVNWEVFVGVKKPIFL